MNPGLKKLLIGLAVSSLGVAAAACGGDDPEATEGTTEGTTGGEGAANCSGDDHGHGAEQSCSGTGGGDTGGGDTGGTGDGTTEGGGESNCGGGSCGG